MNEEYQERLKEWKREVKEWEDQNIFGKRENERKKNMFYQSKEDKEKFIEFIKQKKSIPKREIWQMKRKRKLEFDDAATILKNLCDYHEKTETFELKEEKRINKLQLS